LEDWLLQQEETTKVASFAGRSAPHFYYNITSIPWRPHLAQILVETQNESQLTAFIAKVETFSASSLVGVELIPRRLEQGPPVNAPIEVRLSGDDLSALFQGAETVVDLLAALPGATSVRHSMGLGSPQVQLHFDQDRLNRFGVNRDEVARILLTMSEGLPLGNDWSDEESRPLLLREGPGQEHQLEEILGRQLITMEGKTVPLSQLARVDLDWQPGQFTHRNGRRMVSVSAQLKDGFSFGAVQKALNERLMGISLPEGITWSYGGQAEGSSEANSSLMAALPWGLFLLFALLMAEFNSFRRVMLVLMTVPLAAAGVVPGLLLSGHPFGFMAMLGTIALIGVVVNNAIVLIDFADREQAKGTSIQEAFSLAIDRRLRPILLTTATTVAGLLPLAFSGSSLWPPLAWAMISGLFASTFLTLGAVPALGVLILRPMFSKIKKSSLFSILWVGWLLPALWMIPVQWGRAADQIPPLGLHEAIEASLNHARVRSLQSQQAAVVEEGVLEWRKQRLPALASTASVSWQDQGVILETPLGPFTLGDQDQWHFTTALSQTIYDPVYTYGTRPIREAKIRGADTEVTLAALIQAEGVIRLYFSLLDTQAKEAILKEQQERLAAHHQTLMKRVEAGRSLKVEADDLQWQRQRLALDRQQLEMEKALLWDQLCAQTESPHWRDRLLLLPELRMDLQEQSARRDALAQHPQLQWLSAQRQVVEGSLSASKHSLLPTVEANALYLDSQGDPFTGEDRFSVNLTAKVTWLSKGTRAPERRMLNHQLEALSRQTQSALQALEVHFDSILRAWAQAHHRRNLTREQELLAKNILEVETRRFEAGRITTSQLMDAETNLRSAQEEGILSEHEIRRQSWLSDIALGHVPFIQ
jgi:outer membrane protein TolC